jgi:transcriptional regulator with XRE-family HTH domain
MTSLAELRQKLLTDPEVKAEYDRLGPIFAVIGEMLEARQQAGLTQADVATRMGTSQSVVARLESARHMPTFDMVARYAAAIDRRVDIRLVPSGRGRQSLSSQTGTAADQRSLRGAKRSSRQTRGPLRSAQ